MPASARLESMKTLEVVTLLILGTYIVEAIGNPTERKYARIVRSSARQMEQDLKRRRRRVVPGRRR